MSTVRLLEAIPHGRLSSHYTANIRAGAIAIPFLCLALTSMAQDRQVEFKHLTVADGLSHSQVNAIAQDHQGFLWFGTRAGLNRYDGYECRAFTHNPDDTASLSGNFILSLLVTQDGKLWIGTQGEGIDCYDPVTGSISVYRREFGVQPPTVVFLLEDSGGDLWAGTTFGLYRVVRDSSHTVFELFSDREDERVGSVRALHEDHDGNIWIGTETGVKELTLANRHARRFIAYPHDSNDPLSPGDGIVHGIASDRHGGIWVGTRRGSVRRLDAAAGKVKQYLSDVQERSLYVDNRGDIWVGTLDQGLYAITIDDSGRSQLHTFKHEPDNPHSLGANEVGCIFQDRTGKLWVGTNGGGVSMIDPIGPKFVHYAHIPNDPSSLSDNIVKGLAEDIHGNIWVGTHGGGLDILQSGSHHFLHHQPISKNPTDNLVISIMTRRNGEVWAAFTFSGLLRIFPDGRSIHYQHNPGDTTGLVGINVIRTMYEDRAGKVWIGTHGFGLLMYNQSTDKFVRFSNIPGDSTSLSDNHVWSIAQDGRGYLWVGTWLRGVNRLDPWQGSFQRFPRGSKRQNGANDPPVLFITEDLTGRIWMGTAGDGLDMLEPASKTFTHYHEGHGFPDNMVYGILVDRRNTLWVGTGKGLVHFEPETGSMRLFDVSDGVQSTEFIQGSCCKARDGRMYFGGINGFNVFDPDSITLNPIPPPVVLTRFEVFDKEISMPRAMPSVKEIVLGRDQNFFSFEFAALDFTAPTKNKYSYRLDGFDKGWSTAGNRRRASYTNVGPGTYTFRVKGSNNDGVWNEEGASVIITVLPAFWETLWFRLLAAAVVASIAYSFYHYRVNKLLAIQQTRERIARDLHDEVSAILSGISFFSRSVNDDAGNRLSEKSSHFMALINRSSTEVLELLHDIIWSINPEGDRVDNIAAKLRRYASDLCESRSIRYVISIPETLPTRSVGAEKRKNFWLLYKEMVTNAVRHSECSELKIQLAFKDDGMVHLQVSDNGRGFDPIGKDGRNGLKNIRARAGALNAQLLLETAPGKGTSWNLHCPLLG